MENKLGSIVAVDPTKQRHIGNDKAALLLNLEVLTGSRKRKKTYHRIIIKPCLTICEQIG